MARKRTLNKRKINTLKKNKRKINTLNKKKRLKNTLNKRKRIRNTFKRGGRKGEKNENILMFVSQGKDNKYLKLSYDLNNSEAKISYVPNTTYSIYENNGIEDFNKSSEMKLVSNGEKTSFYFDETSLTTIKNTIDGRKGKKTYNDFYIYITYESYTIDLVPILVDRDGNLIPFKIKLIDHGKNPRWKNNCYRKGIKKWFWSSFGDGTNMTHKKILFYRKDDKIDYFNLLFRIICYMMNLGMSYVNIYDRPEKSVALNGYNRDESICYPDDTCRGSYGSVKIYKDEWEERVALKSFYLETDTKYNDDKEMLIDQFNETVINYRVKNGTEHRETGSQYIAGINNVLVNLPTRQFLHNMMIDCLEIYDSIFFPSLIMEYAGEELYKNYLIPYYKDNSEKITIVKQNRVNFLKQIAEGLRFMNTNNFFHCDVKPENICVKQNGEDYTIKIIDFGHTTEITPEKAKSLWLPVGTPNYKYIGEKRLDLYDIWAYIMVTIDLFSTNISLVSIYNGSFFCNLNKTKCSPKIFYSGDELNKKREEICEKIQDFFNGESSTDPILGKLFNAFTGGNISEPFKYDNSILYNYTNSSPGGCNCEVMWENILKCF